MIGTLYLNSKAAPGGEDWMHVYDIAHGATGVRVKDGQNNWHWFPAHQIQRYSER